MKRHGLGNLVGLLLVLIVAILAIVFCAMQPKEDKVRPFQPNKVNTARGDTDRLTSSKPTDVPITIIVNVFPTPTPTDTLALMPVLTSTLAPVYPILPPIVTTATTMDPSIGKENFACFRDEINKMLVDSDLYIERGGEFTYDLYADLSLQVIYTDELFEYLNQVFINNISHWIYMDDVLESDALNALKKALESSICSYCGRVILLENSANMEYMRHLLNCISKEDYDKANIIMLDFLYRYTKNQYEQRALIICAE